MRYIVLDTETSDIGPDSGVVEIAWAEIDPTLQVVEEVHSRIDPEKPINPAASGVHGITNADVADEPTLSQFFEIIRGSKIAGPTVIIGHNVAFDLQFVRPWIDDLQGSLCTLRLARRYFPDSPNAKLATLKYFLGIDGSTQFHSALGDVRTTVELLRHLVFKSKMTLKELAAVAHQPVWVPGPTFGKFKGKPWREVPNDYLRWLASLSDLDMDLRFTLERLMKDRAA